MKAKKLKNNEVCLGELVPGLKKLSTIKVTKEDIRLGDQGDGETCAIARALKRTLGPLAKDAEVTVGGYDQHASVIVPLPRPKMMVAGQLVEVDLNYDSVQVTLDLDKDQGADTFIEDFDKDRKSVKPRSFKTSVDVELI